MFIIFSLEGACRFSCELRNMVDIPVGFFVLKRTCPIHNTVADNSYNLAVGKQFVSLTRILHSFAFLAFDFRSLNLSGLDYFLVNSKKG